MKSEVLDRLPPQSIEDEWSAIGSVLHDQNVLDVVARILRPEDFYGDCNRRIFKAMLEMQAERKPIDIALLRDHLKSCGEYEAAGGTAHIGECLQSVPYAANAKYYAEIIKRKSQRRAMISAAQELLRNAWDESMPEADVLSEADRSLTEIVLTGSEREGWTAQEAVLATIDNIDETLSKGSTTGFSTGFRTFDEEIGGLFPGELSILGARSSIGKTALAMSMASHIAVKERISCAFFSLEMADMAIMQRLIASEARISSEKIRSGLIKPSDFNALMEAAGRIYEAPLYIIDMPNIKLLDLRTMARRLQAEKGVKIIFVDYLTLITHENADLPRWEQIASISRSLKSLARELRIPVVALSQLKREAEGKQPNLADLRESGSIEQDADLILFLHRDRETGKTREERSPVIETELIIAKQRNGPVGKVEIAFLPAYTRFESIEKRMG